MTQKWIIYGIDYKGKSIAKEVSCKTPDRTKFYKELMDRLQYSQGDLQQVGYTTKEKVLEEKGWLTACTHISKVSWSI